MKFKVIHTNKTGDDLFKWLRRRKLRSDIFLNIPNVIFWFFTIGQYNKCEHVINIRLTSSTSLIHFIQFSYNNGFLKYLLKKLMLLPLTNPNPVSFHIIFTIISFFSSYLSLKPFCASHFYVYEIKIIKEILCIHTGK